MQFNQITYFLRTCDTLNFTKAAAACNVSQPSLSAAIKKLEDELGGELFERQGRAIELTKLGHAMRSKLARVEQARLAANKTAQNFFRQERSTVNLGFMCTLSPYQLMSALSTYAMGEQVDELLIHDISAVKSLEMLISGAVDCMILAHSSPLSDRFASIELTSEPMVLAMAQSHPLAEHKELSLTQLQDINYLDRLGCEFRELFFQEIIDKNLSVNVFMRCEREDLVQKLISEGVGVSIMPKSASVDAGLHCCELTDLKIERNISLVTMKYGNTKPCVDELVASIAAAYNK